MTISQTIPPRPKMGQPMTPPYYHGVFRDGDELPYPPMNLYDLEPWLETAKARYAKLAQAARSPGFAPEEHLRPFLSLLAERLAVGPARVIDFGGGFGDNYLQFAAALPAESLARLEYVVLDTPRNVELGRRIYPSGSPRFVATMDELTANGPWQADLALVCGALQYVPQWREAMAALAKLVDGGVYLTRLQVNRAAPSYSSLFYACPNYGPFSGRCLGYIYSYVLNPQELAAVFAQNGFELAVHLFEQDYSAHFKALPDPWSRVEYAGMLFRRRAAAAMCEQAA